MSYQHILFDLDGTLVRSEEGIFNALSYAYKKVQTPCPSKEILRSFIGPPLMYSLKHHSAMTEDEAQRTTALYREYYDEKGLFECELYPGLESMLQKLHRSGFWLYVATAKPQHFAQRILDYLKLSQYFTQIVGVTSENSRPQKDELIAQILQKHQLDKNDCVMVGDHHFDIDAAVACQLDSIGVLYGYGSKEELQAAGATHLAADTEALTAILLA